VTARQRRDAGIKGGSVISGLHLERDAAQRLCDKAHEIAGGNVAELARFYVRRGLGATVEQANQLEETEYLVSSGLAGLSLDKRTIGLLVRAVAEQGIAKSAIARHLIRRGLGFSERDSKKREAGFAAIANAHQGLHGVFHGASEE
jgi:hypothetical protein